MIEYVLVLIVAVGIILGGLYQLNSAFKVWANNYFGNYLACLLETGELPTISGNPGDSGICNQMFKPFSLADGRPLRTPGPSAAEHRPSGGGGTRETSSGTPARGGYARGGFGGPAFRGGGAGGKAPSRGKAPPKPVATYTGNTAISRMGGGYSQSYRTREQQERKTLVDTRFAFADERERDGRRPLSTSASKTIEIGGKKNRILLKQRIARKNVDGGPSSEFTISGFIRFLIIAAIVIAIVIFLGRQALQIGKSMDGG